MSAILDYTGDAGSYNMVLEALSGETEEENITLKCNRYQYQIDCEDNF